MKLVYSRRALADIDEIANYYSINANPALARSVEARLIQAIERIRLMPEAAPRVSQRSSCPVLIDESV
jgi:plasmid stabilization system protein ParE